MMQIDLDRMAETLANVEEKLNTLGETLNEKKRYKANFVCEEILTNLARHADFEERESDVNLSFDVPDTDTLELLFKDNSNPFNLLDFPDPLMSLDIDERKVGGLGIYLTKKYAKELVYRYENGQNVLKVVL